MSDHFSSLFIKGLKRLWSFEKGLEVLLSGFNPLISNSTKWSNTLDNLSAKADELFECG